MEGPRARTAILRVLFLGASLLAAGCLWACRPAAQPAMARPVPQEQEAPAGATGVSPSPSPTALPSTPIDRLCACTWVDFYDGAFILTFDKLGSRMIERNDPAGIKRTSRITVEEDAILVYDDLGILIARLSYTLTEDSLSIDYGDALGVLEYRAVR